MGRIDGGCESGSVIMDWNLQQIDSLSPQRRALLGQWLEDGRPGRSSGTPDHKRIVAYVVSAASLNGSPAPEPELSAEQVERWREVYEAMYAPASATGPDPIDPTFHTLGWNDSYTAAPIPAEEMREWLDDTVERILLCRPRRVLDIGCGMGLILFRVAPHVEHYLALDFSAQALSHVRRHLTLPQVKLEQRRADGLNGLEESSYDLIILNSVVQYFPSADYLIDVLRQARRLLSPGGFLFLGDIRSLPLLEMLHTSIELHRSTPERTALSLIQTARKAVVEEAELVLAPAFFHALRSEFPDLTGLEIQPKRGRSVNELTRFRYDVTLQFSGSAPQAAVSQWREWGAVPVHPPDSSQAISSGRAGLRHVQVARLAQLTETWQLLAGENCPATVGDLERLAEAGAAAGMDIEGMASSGDDLHLRWSDQPGCLDALIYPGPPRLRLEPPQPMPQGPRAYANDPLRGNLARQLEAGLRRHLAEQVPPFMLPSAYVVMDALPRTASGKVDRKALPSPIQRSHEGARYVAPRNEVEQRLAALWMELLGTTRISVSDSFFDLGGHSLLATQLISRVRRAFQVDLPLQSLFEAPTIASQAELLEDLLLAELEEMNETTAQRLVEGDDSGTDD